MIFQWARIFGYLFLILGILGFVPGITSGGYLFGIFHVNWLHNLIHLFTGVVLLWACKRNECATLKSFQALAVAYGLLALLGLIFNSRLWIGPLAINILDTLFHIVFATAAIYCGFLSKISRSIECGTSPAQTPSGSAI